MDKALKKRIIVFYIAGIMNGLLGLYVLFQGSAAMEASTARTLVIMFLAFAALNFYMAYAIKKKWLADNAAKSPQRTDEI